MTGYSTRAQVVLRLALTLAIFGATVIALAGVGFHVKAEHGVDDTTAQADSLAAYDPGGSTSLSDADIIWTAADFAFESRYPDGFAFTARITSSAGPIVRGRVIWSHVPGTQRSRPIAIDPVTGQLSAVWNVGVGDAVPPWVGITYYWDVGDAQGNSFQTAPQYVEYEDTSRDWLRTESDDIIVFSTGLLPDVNDLAVAAMAEQRATYRAAWGDLLPYKPRAILFGSRTAWNEWQVGVQNDSVIGVTSDDWGGTAQVVAYGDYTDLAYGTVLHEVAHLYQAEFTLMVPGTWVIEGNATFFERNQMYNYEAAVRSLAASDKLPVLLQGTGPGVSGRTARRGYDVGYTFFKWMTDTYGLEAHRAFIELLGQGVGRNQALEAVTGLAVDEIESRWRVWLGASSVASTLIPTPTPLMFPSPTPFSFKK